MAFTESWVETDPDGAVITGSLLDDHQRITKRAVRERLEGDPATPNSGIYESGTFGTTAIVKAGSARAYAVAAAGIAALTVQDGRIAITTDTNRLYHLKATGAVELAYLPLTGGTVTGNLTVSGAVTTLDGTPTRTIIRGTTADSGLQLLGVAASGRTNWLIAKDWTVADNFEIVPSTVVDGITYTTPAFKLTPTGNATFAGTVIATSFSGTVIAAAGTLTGTTLAANVVSSSLTNVGNLTGLTVIGSINQSDTIAGQVNSLSLRNMSSSASALLRVNLGNNASVNAAIFQVYSSVHSTSPNWFEIMNQFSAPLILGTGGVARQTIDSTGGVTFTGNVGIGVAATTIGLIVDKAIANNTIVNFNNTDATNGYGAYIRTAANDATRYVLRLDGGGGVIATFLSNGTVNFTGNITSANITSGTATLTHISVVPTGRVYLDGGGDTYITESSANIVDIITTGGLSARFANTYLYTAGSFLLDPTQKLRLDGNPAGDTYIHESSANVITIVTGATNSAWFNTTGMVTRRIVTSITDFAINDTTNSFNNLLVLDNGNTTVRGTMTATSYFTSSLRKFKQDIVPFERDALALVKDVNIMEFAYKSDPSFRRVGFMAEDVDPVFTGGTGDRFDVINTVAVLLRAVQQMSAKMEYATS